MNNQIDMTPERYWAGIDMLFYAGILITYRKNGLALTPEIEAGFQKAVQNWERVVAETKAV